MNHKIIDVLILVVAVCGTTISLMKVTCLHDFCNGIISGVALIVAAIIWWEELK